MTIKRIAIALLIGLLIFGCITTLVIPNIGKINLTNPSLNIGGPNANAGEGAGSNPNMVGSQTINACAENPALQIEPLRENGQVVPNAFMGLDLNRTEVDSGLRYVLDIPSGTYVQYFEAWTGTTWEATGPTTVVATAWTSWCQNSGWISEQGFPNGQHRQLNANRLPEAIGQWITKQ